MSRWQVSGLVAAGLALGCVAVGQDAGDRKGITATERMAITVMKAWPHGVVATTRKPGEWGYEEGVLLDGLAAEWRQTKSEQEFGYIQAAVDKYVADDGWIRMTAQGGAFRVAEHSLDDIEMGRAVLLVYRTTRQPKYAKAAKFLHDQLATQPRTASGGYWHKAIYPNQMWLDGAYMAEPFRAAYAATFRRTGEFDDVVRQLLLMDAHMREAKTGLLRHGWDESRRMPWADKRTGLSPAVWARAMGWYAMALVDVLDWLPKDHRGRAGVIAALNRTMSAVAAVQDKDTGLWRQVLDRGPAREAGAQGNFLEASASAMFVYALEKGVRMGYLPLAPYETDARRGWEGIQRTFVQANADGTVTLTGTVKAAGLGGTPYRSGTFEYYIAEKTGDDDAKGVGAYLLAGSEMERERAAMFPR